MGRKIPGRKHRGVKDPEKQRAERLEKIKDKINTAPSNPDDQQISSSLSRIIELKDKVKQGLYNKRKNKSKENNNTDGSNKKQFKRKPENEKPIPKMEQRPGETDREFKHRMSRICSEFVREAAFENKYKVDIQRNEDGEVKGVVKRPKDELESLVKKLQKEKNSKKNQKGKKKKKNKDGDQPRLTKSQKWALKKSEKKIKKESEKVEDYSYEPQKELVKFGEIVHAPPSLTAPKKFEKLEGAPRPGQKQLLLKSILNGEAPRVTKDVKKVKVLVHSKNKLSKLKVSKQIDKKGKRKDLPNALRRQLDKQQKEIIEAYKTLKSNKRST